MQQIVEWLEKLGLAQYAHRFAKNDITFAILPDLTDQDLEKIGVASLGHRRQLLCDRRIKKRSSIGGRARRVPASARARSSLDFERVIRGAVA